MLLWSASMPTNPEASHNLGNCKSSKDCEKRQRCFKTDLLVRWKHKHKKQAYKARQGQNTLESNPKVPFPMASTVFAVGVE